MHHSGLHPHRRAMDHGGRSLNSTLGGNNLSLKKSLCEWVDCFGMRICERRRVTEEVAGANIGATGGIARTGVGAGTKVGTTEGRMCIGAHQEPPYRDRKFDAAQVQPKFGGNTAGPTAPTQSLEGTRLLMRLVFVCAPNALSQRAYKVETKAGPEERDILA